MTSIWKSTSALIVLLEYSIYFNDLQKHLTYVIDLRIMAN